jgi:hypothetical protein
LRPTHAADDARPLDAAAPYSAKRLAPVTYDVDFSVIVTAPYHTKTLKVWLPLSPSDAGQEVSGRELSTFPLRVEPKIARESLFGNEFAYFEFDHPEGAQIIRHRFRAKVWELRWNLSPEKVTAVAQWPADFQPYLRRNEKLTADTEFQSTLQKIVPQRGGLAADLISVMAWVDKNLKYDHVEASLRADAEFAFSHRRGHCSDYHGLCAAMSQSLGYPTRVTYGINLFPKNSPSHCKLEAFLPPYGWVSFDVSETQRLVKAIGDDKQLAPEKKESLTAAARKRMQDGFRDNTWLLVTKGTNYELVPPATKPVAVVRTIYAEADGTPLPDPDPANAEKREFGWMTAHEYKADRVVPYPFKDWKTLETSR